MCADHTQRQVSTSMWHTPTGTRTLRGKEWALFREGLGVLWDAIEDANDDIEFCKTEVDVFDRLQTPQKLAMMALVGKALSDRNTPVPQLTALAEGTLAAVLAVIRHHVLFEIDMQEGTIDTGEDGCHMRRLLREAVSATCPSWRKSLPSPNGKDIDTWLSMLEEIEERLLWDSDYDAEENFLDHDPAQSGRLKKQLGISNDYFAAIARDPPAEELRRVRATLRDLTGITGHA